MPVLATRAAPFGRALEGSDTLLWALVGAGILLAAIGCVFHGPRALLLAATCGVFSALTEGTCCWLWRLRWQAGIAHSLAMGLIVALMLPASAPWYVAGTGAILAVGVGKWLMGGLGHYPWNPTALALVILSLLWPEYVTPHKWPLLSRENALIGNSIHLEPLADCPALLGWATADPPAEAIGFSLVRADAVLQKVAASKTAPGRITLEAAVRDLLPSWRDMMIGAVAGPIGMGSALALVFVGFTLVWRGYLRPGLPIAVLCGAFAAAAVLPLADTGWVPIRYGAGGMPYGLVWSAYHTLLASTLFAAVMLAGETVTSPMAGRGQIVYGLGVGALTVALRWWPTAMLAGCWAVLAMNTLVPVIDHLDRRWRVWRTR